MKYVKKLSEAILLQSLEDLYIREHRIEALKFFSGEGFTLCASIIGLKPEECRKIFEMVNTSKAARQIISTAKSIRKTCRAPEIESRIFSRNLRHETVYCP